MHVLFLYTDFVWPPTRGNRVRALSQLRVLASLPEVDRVRFFSLHEDGVTPEQCADLAQQIPKVDVAQPVYHPIHLFRDKRYVPRVAWLRVVRGVPYLAGKWDAPSVRRALEAELTARTYDVVWLGALGLARYLPPVHAHQPLARVVMDTHNVDSEIWRQYASRQHGAKRLVANAEWRAARRFEADALRAVDAVCAISQPDADGIRDLAGVEAVYVPQVTPYVPRAASGRPGRACYVGFLGWHPNVLGLDWFFAKVWPRVLARLPSATLDVAGSGLASDGAGPVVPQAWRAAGVRVLGFVPDLASVYAEACVLVAPVLGGSGVRMKLLEAFQTGVPVVTTPAGAAGLPLEDGREAFIEADADRFAARVVELATSPALQARLRGAAYTYLGRHHGLPAAQAAVRRALACERTAPRAGIVSELEVDERLAAVGSRD